MTEFKSAQYKSPRGFASWRPQERTKPWIEAIQVVLEEDQQFWPVSGRYVMYRLLDTKIGGVVVTKAKLPKIYDVLQRGRRSGIIPWEAISDEGVTVITEDSFENPEGFWDYVGHFAKTYRRPKLQSQPVYVELWTEAAGLTQRVSRTTLPYGVPVYSGGGFDSVSSKYEAAKRIVARGVPTIALHVGDLDQHGHYLFEAVEEDVTEMVETLGGLVQVRRLAVTPEQVIQYDLPLSEYDTFQAEALPASVLHEIITEVLDELLDEGIRRRVATLSSQERKVILRTLQLGRG